jgi:hypothetical protein
MRCGPSEQTLATNGARPCSIHGLLGRGCKRAKNCRKNEIIGVGTHGVEIAKVVTREQLPNWKKCQSSCRKSSQRSHWKSTLVVNVALVRATLSLPVRKALVTNTFVWLDVSVEGQIPNLSQLDEFAASVSGNLFGTYVNPQRTRSMHKEIGYQELIGELVRLAAVVLQLASLLLESVSIRDFMCKLMRVGGYGGTGFRAKEILMDLMDNLQLWCHDDTGAKLLSQYSSCSVIGIGPCRTVNWLLNLPFRFMEDLDPKAKEPFYLVVLEFVAEYLRWLQPETYKNRANFSKQLICVYAGVGASYGSGTDYNIDPDQASKMGPGLFAELRKKIFAAHAAMHPATPLSKLLEGAEETDYL